MKRIALYFLGVLTIANLTGCATIETHEAEINKPPDGIRVFPTRIYLLVDSAKTQIIPLPSYEGAYDVKPVAYLAKNSFRITIKDGQIKTTGSNVDTTAATELMVETLKAIGGSSSTPAGPLPEKELEKPKEETDLVLNGTFGLLPGIYWLDKDGSIKPVKVQ